MRAWWISSQKYQNSQNKSSKEFLTLLRFAKRLKIKAQWLGKNNSPKKDTERRISLSNGATLTTEEEETNEWKEKITKEQAQSWSEHFSKFGCFFVLAVHLNPIVWCQKNKEKYILNEMPLLQQSESVQLPDLAAIKNRKGSNITVVCLKPLSNTQSYLK